MTIEEIQAQKRYKISLLAYLLISYVVSMIISIVLMTVYQNIHSLDSTLFNEIISSGNYLDYLITNRDITLHILNFFSLYNLAVYLLSISVLCFLLKADFIKDFSILKKESIKKTIITFICVTIVFFVLYYSANIISSILIEHLGITDSENQVFVELLLQYALVPMVITTVFLGPIVEELVFRKCIFGLFSKKWIALIVSSLTFTAIHIISSLSLGYNFIELIAISIPYLAGGILFGLIYMKTKYNIYYSIGVHILINLVAVITTILI